MSVHDYLHNIQVQSPPWHAVLGMMVITKYLLLCVAAISATKLDSYFLHSEYDHSSKPCPTCPDIECLHTDNKTAVPLPSTVTFCFRSQPMLYENYLNSWSSVAGFGTIRSDFVDMEEGVIFGVWETGPWLAIKYTRDGPYNWVALGVNFMHDLWTLIQGKLS